MPFQEADIDLMLADSPDVFLSGGVTAPCLLITGDDLQKPGTAGTFQRGTGVDRRVRMAYALIKTSAFPAIKYGDAATVNGTAYIIRGVNEIQGDGGMTEVTLGH